MAWWTFWQVRPADCRSTCVRPVCGPEQMNSYGYPFHLRFEPAGQGLPTTVCGQPLSSLQYSTPGWGFVGVIVSL